jgi:hypothetical protein
MSSIHAQARTAGRESTNSTAFEALARAGLVARGAVYVIIGILAVQVANGSGGTPSNQRGALETIQRQPFGHWLLVATAVGLGGYALWRFVQAAFGHGPEGGGDHSTFGRVSAAVSGCAYSGMCALAVSLLLGASSQSSSNPHKSAAGVLAWPGGQWIVAAAGIAFIGVGIYQGYKGATQDFMKEEKTDRMGPAMRTWLPRIGMAGYLARMVVFGLIGIFVIRAAIDYAPSKAVGLDGALQTLSRQTYGTVLLAIVAAGLVLFGIFSITESRYRRI